MTIKLLQAILCVGFKDVAFRHANKASALRPSSKY